MMRMRTGKEDLVIFLNDVVLVSMDKLGHDCADLTLTLLVEIRDIANDQTIAVETDRVSLLDQATDIVVMTDQFLKH
jgi:hypothetical protein